MYSVVGMGETFRLPHPVRLPVVRGVDDRAEGGASAVDGLSQVSGCWAASQLLCHALPGPPVPPCLPTTHHPKPPKPWQSCTLPKPACPLAPLCLRQAKMRPKPGASKLDLIWRMPWICDGPQRTRAGSKPHISLPCIWPLFSC